MEETNTNIQITVPEKTNTFKEWASDQKAFKGVPWGKAMMWIFLVSDTFVFSIFLISYMTVRFSTKVEWPNASEVFGLHIGHYNVPLLLIAIMTFILITSSGTMALAVKYGYEKNRKMCGWLMLATAVFGLLIDYGNSIEKISAICLVYTVISTLIIVLFRDQYKPQLLNKT